MRTRARRLKVDKLFVLGAGASFSATRPNKNYISNVPPQKQTPLDKHFTGVLKDLEVARPNWVGTSVETIVRGWRDNAPFESLGLEKAILTHSANTKFAKAIHPRRARNAVELEEYLNHLAHLIAFYLKRSREGSQKCYSIFAEKYFSELDTTNRVITFNYDDILESKILAHGHRLNDLYFSKLKPTLTRPAEPGGSDSPLVLKLHGSVNWNCESEDFKNIISADHSLENPLFIKNIWYRPKGTPSSDDDHSPCIIPPIESKPITSIRLFRFLWQRACEYLHECNELYVCGYSLPPTDALASALFKEFNNSDIQR